MAKKFVAKLLLVARTVRHVRPRQIFWQLWTKVYHPKTVVRPTPPVRRPEETWVEPPARPSAMLGPTTFRFLNEIREAAKPDDWFYEAGAVVSAYNLHYFDDLNMQGWQGRREWHRALIGRWIREVPNAKGLGWDAYPTSLRIVNWIKWFLAGNEPDREMLDSLSLQGRHLRHNIEWKLMGNHVLADAKGILFAGVYFSGPEADEWVRAGFEILASEFREEILADGGHYERSPMYHAIILEDLMDVINLVRTYPSAFTGTQRSQAQEWQDAASKMRRFNRLTLHPDGDPAFFNDAARGIAPSAVELDEYAVRLNLNDPVEEPAALAHLASTGFVRFADGALWLLADVGELGPAYQPGHAHADTLSFEASLFGTRVIVNTGTSTYAVGSRRLLERGTSAHNTVVVDGENSSEVWASFRVARRAHPFGFSMETDNGKTRFGCSHDGYRRLPGKVTHRREWRVSQGRLDIDDILIGEFRSAKGYFHFAPEAEVHLEDRRLRGIVHGGSFEMRVEGARLSLEPYEYAPEFGKLLASTCLIAEFEGDRAVTSITWSKS